MKRIFIGLFLIMLTFPGMAQATFKAQVGMSYIEHFSAGVTLSFSEKHHISLLYGSDFFIKTKDFSSYMLQYEFILNPVKFAKVAPKTGLKGGYSVYTSEYYRWEVLTVVPFAGVNYRMNPKMNVFLDGGVAISRALSVTRISFGEIGKYREFLPEIKVGIRHNL
jgi:hypothetical protein